MFSYSKKCRLKFLSDWFSTRSLKLFDWMSLRGVKVIESATDINGVINIDRYTVEEQLMIYPRVVIDSVKT